MTTRKAVVVLKDGRVIEVGNMDDYTWNEYLGLNQRWLSGRGGPVDLLKAGKPLISFEYADIKRIDLWPGSEEPRK